MEDKIVTAIILSMTPESDKIACMKQQLEHAEIINSTYGEEGVKNEIEEKDIVILLLNEETKEEMEECKKAARLAKELHTFTIAFLSDEMSKEVQAELENEVEALVTVSRIMKEPADDVMQAIETFLRIITEVGIFTMDVRYAKTILKQERRIHVTRQEGDIEEVISNIATNHEVENASSIIFHLSMGRKIKYDHVDRLSENIHRYSPEEADINCVVSLDETLENTEAILTLMVK